MQSPNTQSPNTQSPNTQSPNTQSPNTQHQKNDSNIQFMGFDIHNPVFLISTGIITVCVALALIFQEQTSQMFLELRPWVTSTFDWLFLAGANLFVAFSIFLMFSPLGKIVIGGQKAKPEYSYFSWISMLFAAGMGIGLMFYGVLEPLYHTLNPPLGIAKESAEAVNVGIAATIFHWGLHPWAIYAVVALSLAFACYNRGLPLSVRSAFYPLLGERIWGWAGHCIDIIAVCATIFGLATSLGYGAEQAMAGLNFLFQIGSSNTIKVTLIVFITSIALISVLAGLDAGVKKLSQINMILAFSLLLLIIILGPTMKIILGVFQNITNYLKYLLPLSNFIGREDQDFVHGWTTFYWAWWVSWSPFVGMFIARISKGRSVKEFIFFVLLLPTLVSVIWMTSFGGTAIEQFSNGYNGVYNTIANNNWAPELSLFAMLEPLPISQLLSFIGITLVIMFFVTSSDSGSLVIDTITAGGKTNTPTRQRAFWCILEGTIAIALLLGGGLASLQAATISTGLPFIIVLLVMCVALYKGLSQEKKELNL